MFQENLREFHLANWCFFRIWSSREAIHLILFYHMLIHSSVNLPISCLKTRSFVNIALGLGLLLTFDKLIYSIADPFPPEQPPVQLSTQLAFRTRTEHR